MKTLLVSGGNTSKELLTKLLESEKFDFICGVDKGLEILMECKVKIDLAAGDFDSCCHFALEYYEKTGVEIIKLNPEKDDTDTEFALRKVIERGAKEVVIIGGTGSRIDHVLGNISLLGLGLIENVSITLVDENNRIRLVKNGITIKKNEQYGKYVSVIPFSEKITGLFEEGFKYPLENYEMTAFNTIGISNEIVADEGKIHFKDGIAIIIESKD